MAKILTPEGTNLRGRVFAREGTLTVFTLDRRNLVRQDFEYSEIVEPPGRAAAWVVSTPQGEFQIWPNGSCGCGSPLKGARP